eukprot:jgi/Mesvir1/9612/Mv17239-RA.1
MDGRFAYSDAGNDARSTSALPSRLQRSLWRAKQHYLDKLTPRSFLRWLITAIIVSIYCLRVYYLQGYYIVSYGLGIFILNHLIGFLSPQVDPETEGPSLPTSEQDEFKPFVRRLPEFKFWYSTSKAFIIAFGMTFIPLFNVPVFWPILLMYWLMLFVMTMKRQIRHMIKYKYLPFTRGKQSYRRRPKDKEDAKGAKAAE